MKPKQRSKQIDRPAYEEIDLFSDLFENGEAEPSKTETPLVRYVPVKLTEVYKELIEAIN